MRKGRFFGIGTILIFLGGGILFSGAKAEAPYAQTDWKPVEGRILTRWAQDVNPDSVHSEYPRPQMVRGEWLNLNGLWDYSIQPKEKRKVEEYEGRILVPFPVE